MDEVREHTEFIIFFILNELKVVLLELKYLEKRGPGVLSRVWWGGVILCSIFALIMPPSTKYPSHPWK